MQKEYRTVCPHDCPDTCSIIATVDDGKLIKVKGDPEHPFTQGFLCNKVAHYERRVYSPDRIQYPMVRKGKAGELVRVTWDEALDRICERLGSGEAVLPYSYGGNMGIVQRYAGHPFFHRLGASRLLPTICDDAATIGWDSMVGKTVGTDPMRIVDSDYILIWGCNVATVNVHLMPLIRAAQRRGAKVVVVDAYRTDTARLADEYVTPRPGTDGALALGMARVLVDEGLINERYIEQHTEGFERFKQRLQQYSPERCTEICGVGDIARLAHDLGRAQRPFLRLGLGFSRHENGGQAVRCVTALAGLVGAFEQGGALLETCGAFEFNLDVIQRADLLPHGTREINMVKLGDALTEDDSIRSLFVYQSNPAAVCPDQTRVRKGLSRKDLFVVVHEQMWTDTVDYADVVVPACTSFETNDIYRSYGHYYLQRAGPVIKPLGEAKSNVELFNALAGRLGFEEDIFSCDEEQRIRLLLDTRKGALANIDMEGLNEGKPVRLDFAAQDPFADGFPTESGRFRFANDSLPDPLPGYAACEEGYDSALRNRYPLQLLVPSAKHFLNSSFGGVAELVARQRRPTVLLHPAEAEGRDALNGELLRVFNDRGETFATLIATEDVPPGIAVLPSIWWGRDTRNGYSANALTSSALTDLGGSSTFHCALVQCEVVNNDD